MINMYDEIRGSLHFNKFAFGEMLFVEYTCPIEEDTAGIWTPCDSFAHVLKGKKTWKTPEGSWTAEKGQTLFLRKGASIIQQYPEEEFCVLLLFLTEDFVLECVTEVSGQLPTVTHAGADDFRALTLRPDVTLTSYFHSMLSYFSDEKPPESLLIHKLKELILGILLTDRNPELSAYFQAMLASGTSSLKPIMEANFCFNLSMDDFARLSNRSLSSFKRDFRTTFNETPAKWLKRKRLEYAAVLLKRPEKQIAQVSLECGFEDVSHFSRSFKAMFGLSPGRFRKESGFSA